MKKSTVISLIVSFILMGVGISLIIVGIIFGGFGQARTFFQENISENGDVISSYSYKIEYPSY